MSKSNLTFQGPLQDDAKATALAERSWQRRAPWALLVVVVAPTVLTAIYYLLLASPQYVSEAHFIVRSAEQKQPSPMGMVLQGVGLSAAQGDAFAVQEYMTSRDATAELAKTSNLVSALSRSGADILSRFPRPWEKPTNDSLHKNFQRFLTVGYDSSTGISTVRVSAFNPADAQRLNKALLVGGENLINRLNERSSASAVRDAERDLVDAQQHLAQAQSRVTQFRNREGLLDPQARARENAEVVAGLATRLAELRAEKTQLASSAPQSPRITALDNSISALQAEIARERAAMAGSSSSLAPIIGTYEALRLDVELADRGLAAARATLETAKQDARRQQLYLEQVVAPNLPDQATEPKRLRAIILALITTLIIYGLGWLVVAGVREHKQT